MTGSLECNKSVVVTVINCSMHELIIIYIIYNYSMLGTL